MAYTTINKGSSYFNTVLYTGTGSSTSITTGFGPDLVWIKGDVGGTAHYWFDSVRGTGKNISSNNTNAEVDWTGGPEGSVSAFNATSFSLSADTNGNANYSGRSYISWSWRGSDSSAVTNNSGSITTTVSANTTAGFSIFTYTGTGSNATLGHGLGVAPKVVFIKCRSSDNDWRMYHASLPTDYVIYLNSTYQQDLNATVYNGAPTSTTIGIKTNTTNNGSGSTYVGYAFAEVKGFSKFGSYTGNASNDGTFVYTGFKPAFIIMKRTGIADNWLIKDSVRDSYNVADKRIYPNQSSAEDTSVNGAIDLLSNGFKHRSSNDMVNPTGEVCVYMAFAENPFVLTDGTPVTAR